MALLLLLSGKPCRRDRVRSLKYERITKCNLLMQLKVITSCCSERSKKLTNALSGHNVVSFCSVASGTCYSHFAAKLQHCLPPFAGVFVRFRDVLRFVEF